MLARLAVAALLLAGLPTVAVAASWWNPDWQYRKEITLDASPAAAAIAGSATDVPVLLRLSIANFEFFGDAKPDGADFRVIAADDKTPLEFHFERYDAANQMAYLWVRLPKLAGGATPDKLFLYYGNPAASTAANEAGTYDAPQAMVLQFGETEGLPKDATGYGNAANASTGEPVAASLIAGGMRFNGQQSVVVPASPSLRASPDAGFTASAWVKIDAPQAGAAVVALEDDGLELVLGIDGLKPFARVAAGGAPATATAVAELVPGTWHHLAATWGGGSVRVYVDGVESGSAPASGGQEFGGTLTVAGSVRGTGFLVGEVDEVQAARVARPADWLRAAARSQGMDANLVAYGADGQRDGGGHTSYFGTIAKNLTVDGWVVIVICFVMLLIALAIMALKAIFLSRVERANAKFLADYRKLTGDATSLDEPAAAEDEEFEQAAPMTAALAGDRGRYGPSTLYRLYHAGVAELNKRVAGRAVGAQRARVLSPQSVEAIRASLDASLTRMGQRLSAQMVLLTIAISGGPFLGLLGTVIGVMITFAAIAASGDVNVNAIAPGTAAALAATVAGLAVAIPALFGYNWLNTRIKAINADNRVFVDEFVARIAEQYS